MDTRAVKEYRMAPFSERYRPTRISDFCFHAQLKRLLCMLLESTMAPASLEE